MVKRNELSLDKIVLFLTNGENFSEKEFTKFKKSEYCKEVIDIGNENKIIILNKSIGELFEITVYYHSEKEPVPYSTVP